ncbi:hypothetical protein B0H34DRAFT_684963 [Crassisporium funariophilum]|nr:hypothetical protein B0H34DRAFT_684963 [Crassisporium funariophilum]
MHRYKACVCPSSLLLLFLKGSATPLKSSRCINVEQLNLNPPGIYKAPPPSLYSHQVRLCQQFWFILSGSFFSEVKKIRLHTDTHPGITGWSLLAPRIIP